MDRPSAASSRAASATGRLYFLDNLRVALTVLVIAHHVGQAYGPTGSDWPVMEAVRADILGPFFSVNRSFFMSLFFMISGYLMIASYESSAGRGFVGSRLSRLGIPLIIWVVFLSTPFRLLADASIKGIFGAIWPIDVGHLWYVEHLLLFSLGYAAWRALNRGRAAGKERLLAPPGYVPVLVFAVALALASAIVRTWFPIDRWLYLLGFHRVAFADVPRDLAFFVIGVLAYRNQWVTRYPVRQGLVWLAIAVVASVLWTLFAMVIYPRAPVSDAVLGLAYPLWESVLCCGLCIGLVVLFREWVAYTSGPQRALARGQYAAYVFPVPIVIGVQALVLGLALPPLAKFALVTLAAVPLSFFVAHWVRRPLRM